LEPLIVIIFSETKILTSNSLSIYIHWPFCQSKCPYCDFNSHVRTSIDHKEWTNAYIDCLTYWVQKIPKHQVCSIFFGGGTPSLMSEETVDKILNTISKLWKCNSNLEISLEANPTSVEAKKFKSFQESGVNRLSMGIQALNDIDLKRLGRLHTTKEAKEAFSTASNYFNRVSFDLMYGRQHQTLEDWEMELSSAISMSVGHLSLYQLTIEENTRFGDLFAKGKLRGLPKDEISVEFYNLTQNICELNNLPAYEISNHAKIGHECQHNLSYWNGLPFLGIGPGAHGRVDINAKRYQTEAPSNPERWLQNVKEEKMDLFNFESISNTEQAEEYIMMGIRLRDGIDLSQYSKLSRNKIKQPILNELVDSDLITIKEQKLKTTKTGKIVTDYIIRKLLC
jgi:putative oxygen-independent coproporphyrinogen III oxidase